MCAELSIGWLMLLWASCDSVQLGKASWTVDSLIEFAILHQPCIRTAAPNPACTPVSVGMAKPLADAIRTPLASPTCPPSF